MTRFFLVATLAALAAAAGCGGSSPATPVDAGEGADQFVDCSTDTRAMPYQNGMQVMSKNGLMMLTLESVPGPPIKGTNTWTIQVNEAASGTPLDGLNIAVMPWMVDHDHGTRVVEVTPSGTGTYTLQPVYLYMSGTWDVRFTITGTPTPTDDTASFWICIP
jgi:hypothetical protein